MGAADKLPAPALMSAIVIDLEGTFLWGEVGARECEAEGCRVKQGAWLALDGIELVEDAVRGLFTRVAALLRDEARRAQ
jgi:hypothetical protein